MVAWQLTWWCQLNNGRGASNYATIDIKEMKQRHTCHLGRKWRCDGSTGGVSSAMVGVAGDSDEDNGDANNDDNAETMTTTRTITTVAGALGSMRERMQQLRSAKG